MNNAQIGVGCGNNTSNCSDSDDCVVTPNLCIKRGDTKPIFKISFSDCDGPIDLSEEENLVLEANMWIETKLKANITDVQTSLAFADNIGFNYIKINDIVITSSARSSEKMIVTNIDEVNKTATVTRAYEATTAKAWDKGTVLYIFRFRDQPAQIESVFENIESVDGTTNETLTDTIFSFEWSSDQTLMPGCYWFEFKLMKIDPDTDDILWTKRIPLSSSGFMIKIIDSATSL